MIFLLVGILFVLVDSSSLLSTKPPSLLSASLLSLPVDELGRLLGGSGKAKLFWSMIREGRDVFGSDSLLSAKAQDHLHSTFSNFNGDAFDAQMGNIISTKVSTETVSSCGGRKQLHTLPDRLEVESVIIPHERLPRTTLCVSSQVGCDRGCIFCATGKMGLVRNLSADEILSQLYWAKQTVQLHELQPLKNIVFMGMGDIGMNLETVKTAYEAIVDRDRFAIAPSKVTLSTVGPHPGVFEELAQVGGTLAWSLHSAVPELRKKLVPSSKFYEPAELRDALLSALLKYKSPKNRSIMIAVTLLHGINCQSSDAEEIVKFMQPFLQNGVKVNIDLIPYNDIAVGNLQRPTDKEIVSFKDVLWRAGLNHSVRLTRGENEASACGMLATSRRPRGIEPAPAATLI